MNKFSFTCRPNFCLKDLKELLLHIMSHCSRLEWVFKALFSYAAAICMSKKRKTLFEWDLTSKKYVSMTNFFVDSYVINRFQCTK